MSTRTYIKTLLIVALTALSIGGLILHIKIHPFMKYSYGFVPYVSCLLSIALIPCLLSFRKTLDYGYVLNGMLVIIGTITMTHFSIIHWPKTISLEAVLMDTTLADVTILWAKFFIGKAIFDLEIYGYRTDQLKSGISWRYPHLGWWMIHLVVISIVYGLGSLAWR